MFTVFEQAAFSADKLRDILGYQQRVSFSEGMAQTARWIQWARL
jgi:nucleoside-diphosphate-sugar epimerase